MVVGRRRGKETHPGKPTVTYPCWVRLGTVLERQNPHSGKTKETLESRYLAGPGQPEHTGVAPQPGIDVERLDDEEVKELVKNWASGHKIKFMLDRETGLDAPHVLVHSLTPHLLEGKPVLKEDGSWFSAQRGRKWVQCTVQVDTFHLINFLCFNAFYAGSPPQTVQTGPSSSDQEEAQGDGEETAERSEVGDKESES